MTTHRIAAAPSPSWWHYTGGTAVSGVVQTSTVPVWNTGLTARKTANNAVYDRVLGYAGARPGDRDSTDRNIVSHVRNRSGGIINCVAAERHQPVQSQCGRLALVWAAYAQAHTAVESEQYPRERLHQPRELAAFDGSDGAGRDFQLEPGAAGLGGGGLKSM